MKPAVHGIFPDMAPLAALVDGDPYGREGVTSSAHIDALVTMLGIGRKKSSSSISTASSGRACSPRPARPSPGSRGERPLFLLGLFFGIHEALKALKARGILLVSVSKNDEATVRELWKYPAHYPHDRLLTPDDFVTWRVNWTDKVDEHPRDRRGDRPRPRQLRLPRRPPARARAREGAAPGGRGLGRGPLRAAPQAADRSRLQPPRLTETAAGRTALVKAQLDRAKLRGTVKDERDFIASLQLDCTIERLSEGASLDRIAELFQRTTQFNTTGRKFSRWRSLPRRLDDAEGGVYSMHVTDCFADHGLVGAAVVISGDIVGFALSCRVIGLGVEHRFLDAIFADLAPRRGTVEAAIIETSRNLPARHLYRDHGFLPFGEGRWRLALPAQAPSARAS